MFDPIPWRWPIELETVFVLEYTLIWPSYIVFDTNLEQYPISLNSSYTTWFYSLGTTSFHSRDMNCLLYSSFKPPVNCWCMDCRKEMASGSRWMASWSCVTVKWSGRRHRQDIECCWMHALTCHTVSECITNRGASHFWHNVTNTLFSVRAG